MARNISPVSNRTNNPTGAIRVQCRPPSPKPKPPRHDKKCTFGAKSRPCYCLHSSATFFGAYITRLKISQSLITKYTLIRGWARNTEYRIIERLVPKCDRLVNESAMVSVLSMKLGRPSVSALVLGQLFYFVQRRRSPFIKKGCQDGDSGSTIRPKHSSQEVVVCRTSLLRHSPSPCWKIAFALTLKP